MYPEFTIEPFGRYDRKQQQSLLSIGGTGNLLGATETQSALYSGARSNVFVPAGSVVTTLNVIDDIDTGIEQSSTQLTFATESSSVTHAIGNRWSWPEGDISGGTLPTGWDYIPGSGSADNTTVVGLITNNTGITVAVYDITVSVTIDVTTLPTDGTTRPTFGMELENGFTIAIVQFDEISATGSYTVTASPSNATSSLEDADSLRVFLFENMEADQGFTYTVTNLDVNIEASTATAYNLDIDTTDTVFNGNVAASFTNEASATEAVQQMASGVTAMFPTITAGDVYDSIIIETTPSIAEYISRDTTGVIAEGSWDVRDAASTNSTSVTYATWADWTGNFFGFGQISPIVVDSIILRLVLIGLFGNYNNTTLTITDNSDPSISATFGFDETRTVTNQFVELTTLISQSGVPGIGDVVWDFVVAGEESSKAIDLNTNQLVAIDQMLVLTQNSGRNAFADVSSADSLPGSGQVSTYTVTDPYGMEVTSFTSFVSSNTESDVASVVSTMVNAINNNNEMPIDFRATSDGSSITISAQSAGAIPTTWTLFVNHHDQVTDAGNISFGAVIPTTTGTDLSVTLSGGGLDSDVVLNDTSLTKAEVIQELTTNIPSGVAIYEDVNADLALIADDFVEQPALDIDVSGDINNTLTFETSTKYWGHT